MKKALMILPLLLLCSCGSPSSSAPESSTSSSSEISSEESVSSVSSVDSSTSGVSLFDKNLIGTWYISSAANGFFEVNDEITVYPDTHLEIGDVYYLFKGQFENYEETCLFKSEDDTSTIVLQFMGDSVSWGYEDIDNNIDIGYAESEPYSPESFYSYVGPDWPMDLVKTYLNTTGELPVYEAAEYKLHNGVSDLYGIKYSMIDIYNVPDSSLTSYVALLNENGFAIIKDPYSSFYVGADENQEYYLRLSQYTDEKELCIFIYKYSEFVH